MLARTWLAAMARHGSFPASAIGSEWFLPIQRAVTALDTALTSVCHLLPGWVVDYLVWRRSPDRGITKKWETSSFQLRDNLRAWPLDCLRERQCGAGWLSAQRGTHRPSFR